MTRSTVLPFLMCCVLGTPLPVFSQMQQVNESGRELPVAYDVDVVVIGGGTGAVQAALSAAESGASVFLAAPFPYLGDDMTATLRLWLEPGETPSSALATALFNDAAQKRERPNPNQIAFSYQADQPTAQIHRDSDPPSRLTDHKWVNPSSESVQYEADVNIVADLKKPQLIHDLRLMAFYRPQGTSAGTGFDVDSVTVSLSDDGTTWTEKTVVKKEASNEANFTLRTPIDATSRYVRLFVKLPKGFERMLLGELEINGPPPEDVPIETEVKPPPRPMHIKKTLDDALIDAGVPFLYSCYATDVLVDADGAPCGIAMVNRAGRQAVIAKTIIDATDRSMVTRLAGAEFQPYPSGLHTFRRVVIGGDIQKDDRMTARVVEPPYIGPYPNKAKTSSGIFPVIEYTLKLPMPDASYASWAKAEQTARTLTYHAEQQFTSDVLFEVPPDPVRGLASASDSTAALDALPLGVFQPAEVPHVYVLGGCADVSRRQAEMLLRPLNLMAVGERIGKAAAADAKEREKVKDAHLPGRPSEKPAATGDVSEFLTGLRATQHLPTIPQTPRALPVLGRYDVVVIGGGTAGAPAGIAAARQGAKTLVVEYLHGLGGVGTLGAISSYYWGNRVGFTATIPGEKTWVIEQKMEWYRSNLLDAGGDLWFGTIGCGAFKNGKEVIGAVVATPFGRGVVLANTVIDATGNSDVAAAAGAECVYTDASEFGMQGTGLPGRKLGETYNNTDFTIVDETDILDIWRMFVFSKDKYKNAFDHGQLIDTRERRRIVGEFTITLPDEINERTQPDTVVQAYSNFDTHGYTIDPYLLVEHPEKVGVTVHIPYRSLLPKDLERILVIGLGISAHRDAVPLIRMQPDIQNGGYAAGVAAAMAARNGVKPREIDVRALQQHLIDVGNLPTSVLTDEDSYPLSDEEIAQAVENLKEGKHGASVIMAEPERAIPLLRKAMQSSEGEARLTYAKTLCILGQTDGIDLLISEVEKTGAWDKGWNYRGMGQFGSALSRLDILIMALGRTRSVKALPAILAKTALLDAEHDFSHHRAVGQALELISDASAAEPLATLLAKPEMTGYAHTTIQISRELGVPGGTTSEETRRESLRELLLARALYRCGDFNGIGEKILRAYTHDLRGHLARHAQAVLDAGHPQ